MGEDGKDFINVYSKGLTPLGRFLSNFEKCVLDLPEGRFSSVEGYWYYLNCFSYTLGREKLKELHGFKAKEYGRSLTKKEWNDDPEFKTKILFAIFQKLLKNPFMFEKLKACELPLVHYYVHGGKRIEPSEGKWILDFLNGFRRKQCITG